MHTRYSDDLRFPRFPRFPRFQGACLVFAAAAAAGCASMQAPSVPEAIRAPAGEKLAQKIYAKGVQMYKCLPGKSDPAKNEWTFQAPEAGLFSDAGMQQSIGKHYAGPTWEGLDGSKVVGEVKGNVASTDSFSIPWLLLTTKSTSGSGVFSNVSSIQRVDTKGGRSPQGNCSENQKDVSIRVDYTSLYYFYTR